MHTTRGFTDGNFLIVTFVFYSVSKTGFALSTRILTLYCFSNKISVFAVYKKKKNSI